LFFVCRSRFTFDEQFKTENRFISCVEMCGGKIGKKYTEKKENKLICHIFAYWNDNKIRIFFKNCPFSPIGSDFGLFLFS